MHYISDRNIRIYSMKARIGKKDLGLVLQIPDDYDMQSSQSLDKGLFKQELERIINGSHSSGESDENSVSDSSPSSSYESSNSYLSASEQSSHGYSDSSGPPSYRNIEWEFKTVSSQSDIETPDEPTSIFNSD